MRSYTSLSDIRHDLKHGAVKLEDLVGHYLSNIEQGRDLNVFLEVFADEAKSRALEIQDKIKAGTEGKLAGLVIAIKDNIVYKAHKASGGSKILEGFTSLFSATVVERLLAEDAIIIGRTNCDEFAMGSSNENSAYGPVKNPLDPTTVPGGSSGGSAAAVAAHMCHASLGSDTGGSIRQPASLTGIVGIKPTYGRVSRHGLMAFASSFDQIGTFTHSVEDAARILEVISGPDEYDGTLADRGVETYSEWLPVDKPLTIGYVKQCLESPGLDEEIRQRVNDILQALRDAGHTVKEVELPLLDHLVPTYYVLTTAEASSNLARYDGIHYGYRASGVAGIDATYARSRTEGFGKEVKRRIMLGTFVLSAGYYD
ncbi:MAG: Asp-tRNA(Asn)/Glu-tRNA(Gln) amidotransferase subunit GatA, partial [Flavobacteriales bacterium]|nr:Asp-tRNA(Asn)/Glu-tRNA(Gln) amidotransferase subunit GatA [Flavobacteriales bacterium]